AWIDWFLGYPEQARRKATEAVALARRLAHPFSLVWALACAAFLQQFLRDSQQTQKIADEALTLSQEQGFSFMYPYVEFWRGWSLAQQGRLRDGFAQMHRGLTDYGTGGGGVGWPFLLALLAETSVQVGKIKEGLQFVDEALTVIEKNTDRCYEPEVYRIKGELKLQKSKKNILRQYGLNAKLSAVGLQREA